MQYGDTAIGSITVDDEVKHFSESEDGLVMMNEDGSMEDVSERDFQDFWSKKTGGSNTETQNDEAPSGSQGGSGSDDDEGKKE